MKSKWIFLIPVIVGFIACTDDEPDTNHSIITVETGEQNEFDGWLLNNYIYPYNIEFKYRMEDIESDMDYTLVPAEMKKSVQLAKLIKHLCIEAYDELAGPDYIRNYFPKVIHIIGSFAFRNNGTFELGTAEGGMKITLYGANYIDPTNINLLNEWYFKTIHHEFTHIFTQTKEYTSDFQLISGTSYVGDAWNDYWSSDADAQKAGFVSQYASKEANEDFAENVCIYLTQSSKQWDAMLTGAGTAGAEIIKQKFEVVYNYMKDSWNIDLNQLRDIVQRRSSEIDKLDLENF